MPKHELSISSVFETLVKISATTKRKEKDALMSSVASSATAHEFFKLATDKRANLWVTVPNLDGIYFKGKKQPADLDKRWKQFKELYHSLSSRHVTGAKAIEQVKTFIASCNNEAPLNEATWYAGAINRHLNIGVSDSSLKKIWPDLVSDFAVQLAESLYDQKTMQIVKKVKDAIKFPCVDEPKLDGVNASLVSFDFSGSVFSRANKAMPALQPWFDAFSSVLKSVSAKGLVPKDFVLNGEFKADLHKDDPKNWKSSWGKTIALCHAGIKAEGFDEKNIDAYSAICLKRDMYFTIYNCYPFETYSKGSWDVRYGDVNDRGSRSWLCAQFAAAMRKKFPNLRVYVIDQELCHNVAELKKANARWLKEKAEGSMIKSCEGICELERGTYFIKWKQYAKIDAVILGVNRGTGKYANSGGTFACYLPGKDDIVNVTCRTEQVRDWAMKNKDLISGYYLEVVEDGADDDVAKTRNPILARFRNDVPPMPAPEVVKLFDRFKDKLKTDKPKRRLSVSDFNQVTSSFNM